MPLLWEIATTCLTVLFASIFYLRQQSACPPLPPGPPKDILIGHARKLPVYKGWEVYAKWNKEYGDVIYVEAFGRSMVVLNSVTAARDLLEKKSSTFSDRAFMPVYYEMGWELILPFLRYGSRFRKHRRILHQYFGPQAIPNYKPIVDREIHKFLRRLLTNPDNFIEHINCYISGIIISATYGHEVVSVNDPFVKLVEQAAHMTSDIGNAGTTILDIFPFMRHAPAWLPGMGIKQSIIKTQGVVDMLMAQPLEELKEKRVKGSASSCLISELLDRYEETRECDPEHEKDIMNIGAGIHLAGTDTTKSALKTLFLLMTIYPDTAKKAQEEIDRVVGRDRLPSINDRSDLPYLECILKESYRIHPPTPLGLPHRSTHVEHYRGWVIPEGTIAITNTWLMMRDEKYFPNPDVFMPERHMLKIKAALGRTATTEKSADSLTTVVEDDPSSILFGFGRRACPGQYLADSSLWLAIANVLAMFDIKPYTDQETGKTDIPKLEFDSDGLASYPIPFRCKVIPRDSIWADDMTANIGI